MRVDLEALGINEDEFDDLQSLFEVNVLVGWICCAGFTFGRLVDWFLDHQIMPSPQLFDRDRDGILTVRELQVRQLL